MSYYTRILGKHNPNIHLDELIDALASEGLTAKFSLSLEENSEDWTVLQVSNEDNEVMVQVERSPVIEGELGQEELNDFREDIKEYKPESAVRWLNSFFDKVEVIYAFEHTAASFEDKNLETVNALKAIIWNKTNGIFQSDGEGLTNEDGYYILWQFSEDVTGDCAMAVQNSSRQWINFIMDLGNQNQREEFWKGNVPNGVKVIEIDSGLNRD